PGGALLARALAPAEAAGTLALDAAAEATGGHVIGVPLVASVTHVVDTADVDQLLETELVAQGDAGGDQVLGAGLEGDFTTGLGHGDRGAGEPVAQSLGKGGSWLGHGAWRFRHWCARGAVDQGKISGRWCCSCSPRPSACARSSSAAAGCRRPALRPSAGSPGRRCPPARCGHSRAPPSTSSGSSRRRWRSCPSR